MYHLLTITWDMGRGLDLGFFTLRYYSLLFAAGFVLGYLLMKRIFKKEGIAIDKLDTLLTYVVIATIVGARLGHVFFYQWDYYSQHPGEIIQVWKGGLASHGAAIGIIIAVIIYCKRVLHRSTLWMLDRLVLTIALAAMLIRLGNWFNSEIYGQPANSATQTVFLNPARERITDAFNYVEKVDFTELNKEEVTDSLLYPMYTLDIWFKEGARHDRAETALRQRMAPYLNGLDVEDRNIIFPQNFAINWDLDQPSLAHVEVMGMPRYPTQLYEALAYFLIFLILYRLYLIKGLAIRQGFLFGSFLILLFGFRFFIEYYKEVQVAAEKGQSLNIGQSLSIPMVAAGIVFLLIAKPKEYDQGHP